MYTETPGCPSFSGLGKWVELQLGDGCSRSSGGGGRRGGGWRRRGRISREEGEVREMVGEGEEEEW